MKKKNIPKNGYTKKESNANKIIKQPMDTIENVLKIYSILNFSKGCNIFNHRFNIH